MLGKLLKVGGYGIVITVCLLLWKILIVLMVISIPTLLILRKYNQDKNDGWKRWD